MKHKIAAPITIPIVPYRLKVDLHPNYEMVMMEKELKADPIYTPEFKIEFTVDLLFKGK